METNKRYSLEIRERVVRMVFEHRGEHESQWAAIGSIAVKIGCTADTLPWFSCKKPAKWLVSCSQGRVGIYCRQFSSQASTMKRMARSVFA